MEVKNWIINEVVIEKMAFNVNHKTLGEAFRIMSNIKIIYLALWNSW